jgi:predicted lysophospholipase L1 biosynthesis ABC-type transport system permease subunit
LPLVLTVETFHLSPGGRVSQAFSATGPEDAVDRAARRVAAEEKKKKDAKKARARERTRARDALEKLHRR